jgi:hypothetical protein
MSRSRSRRSNSRSRSSGVGGPHSRAGLRCALHSNFWRNSFFLCSRSSAFRAASLASLFNSHDSRSSSTAMTTPLSQPCVFSFCGLADAAPLPDKGMFLAPKLKGEAPVCIANACASRLLGLPERLDMKAAADLAPPRLPGARSAISKARRVLPAKVREAIAEETRRAAVRLTPVSRLKLSALASICLFIMGPKTAKRSPPRRTPGYTCFWGFPLRFQAR